MRADIIYSQREIKEISTLKKSPFPLPQSLKVHRRALVLLPCLLPCHRCEKFARESPNSHHLITQRDNIHARTTSRAWISADIWRQDGAIWSKNRKIVPYHRCARIPRLTVSDVPDYGSWFLRWSRWLHAPTRITKVKFVKPQASSDEFLDCSWKGLLKNWGLTTVSRTALLSRIRLGPASITF